MIWNIGRSIFLSMPTYNSWRFNFPFLWVIFLSSLIPYFLWYSLFLRLEKIVSIMSQNQRKMFALRGRIMFIFQPFMYSLERVIFMESLLMLVHLEIEVFLLLVKITGYETSMMIAPSLFINTFSQSWVLEFLSIPLTWKFLSIWWSLRHSSILRVWHKLKFSSIYVSTWMVAFSDSFLSSFSSSP